MSFTDQIAKYVLLVVVVVHNRAKNKINKYAKNYEDEEKVDTQTVYLKKILHYKCLHIKFD